MDPRNKDDRGSRILNPAFHLEVLPRPRTVGSLYLRSVMKQWFAVESHLLLLAISVRLWRQVSLSLKVLSWVGLSRNYLHDVVEGWWDLSWPGGLW